MRRFVVLLAFGIAACAPEWDDLYFASGRVLDVDGAPVANGKLSFERMRIDEDATYDPDPEHWGWEPFRDVTTDAAGRFTLDVQYGEFSYVSRKYGGEGGRAFRLIAPEAPDGTRTSASFGFPRRSDARLPTVRSWASAFSAEPSDSGVSVSFAPLPPTDEVAHPLHVLELLDGDDVSWFVRATPGLKIDEWILAGAKAPKIRARAYVGVSIATKTLYGDIVDSGVRISGVSPSKDLPAVVHANLAEGASCVAEGLPEGPCPFTDGKAEPVKFGRELEENYFAGLPEVTISLANPAHPHHVVVRRLDMQLLGTWGRRRWGDQVVVPERVVLERMSDGVATELVSWPLPEEPPFDPERAQLGGYPREQIDLFDLLQGESFEGELDGSEVGTLRLRALAPDGSAATLFSLAELSLYE